MKGQAINCAFILNFYPCMAEDGETTARWDMKSKGHFVHTLRQGSIASHLINWSGLSAFLASSQLVELGLIWKIMPFIFLTVENREGKLQWKRSAWRRLFLTRARARSVWLMPSLCFGRLTTDNLLELYRDTKRLKHTKRNESQDRAKTEWLVI